MSKSTPKLKRAVDLRDELAVDGGSLTDTDLSHIVALFRILGDPARLQTLVLLGESERCVGEISEALSEKLSTTSQRLRLLRGLQLVESRRAGKNIFYRLTSHGIPELVAYALRQVAANAIPATLADVPLADIVALKSFDGSASNDAVVNGNNPKSPSAHRPDNPPKISD